ncbi:MAG: hypothetical protein ACE15C_02120 [Phycisphaerae bacterium]
MAYPSVDRLQRAPASDVFHYAKDAKKAAGRALGTLVEIITFYALKSWGLERNVAIERPLSEFANADITHNVEFSLHPAATTAQLPFGRDDIPLTTRKIARTAPLASLDIPEASVKSASLLSSDLTLRNSCTVCDLGGSFFNAYLDDFDGYRGRYSVVSLLRQPYAIVECKRVGIEEGMRKGPQTIEKAKQGAYVARMVSALQKVRFADGKLGGLIQRKDGSLRCEEYYSLLAEIIRSDSPELLARFILTVGVVSNHGNWFTSENHNKELKVLAQSYDWLLFLTDAGIAQFVEELILHPDKGMEAAKRAFLASYTGSKGRNKFTKVLIALEADAVLKSYFARNQEDIEGWFNIITPLGKKLRVLKDELNTLAAKNWREMHT